jgi:predicted nucleic acid-binding protein
VSVFLDTSGLYAILPIVRMEWVSEEDHRGAIQAVLAAGRRELSLVDCTSFLVMRRLGLKTAFAFDRDYTEQGFETLPVLRSGG